MSILCYLLNYVVKYHVRITNWTLNDFTDGKKDRNDLLRTDVWQYQYNYHIMYCWYVKFDSKYRWCWFDWFDRCALPVVALASLIFSQQHHHTCQAVRLYLEKKKTMKEFVWSVERDMIKFATDDCEIMSRV